MIAKSLFMYAIFQHTIAETKRKKWKCNTCLVYPGNTVCIWIGQFKFANIPRLYINLMRYE